MKNLSRREFVGTAGVVSLMTAKSYSQIHGAGDRLRVGVIGCGSRGTAHIKTLMNLRQTDNVEVVAVCDVFDKRAQKAVEFSGAKSYRDYRNLLADKTIDYVVIATPDHWHAQITLDALDAGKHVYCEKPMTHTVEEAKRVAAKVLETGLKMQVGVQGMSDDSYETAYRYVQQGVLGKVLVAQVDYSRNYRGDFWLKPVDPDLRPGENFDWDLYVGPAPKRPFAAERYFQWIRYWDYSGGIPSGLFVHRVTRIIRSLGLTFPEYGSAHGGKFQFSESIAEIPDTLNIMLDYPGGPTVLLVSSLANDTPVEHVLRGHKATLHFTPTGFVIRPQKLYAGEMREIVHQKTGGEDTALHHKNLMAAIRSNEPLKCDVKLGYYGVVACQMGVISYRKRKYAAWHKQTERIVLS